MTQQAVRKAVQTALGEGEMLAAGFGDTRFFIVEGNHFPKGTPFYSDAGTAAYNERDAKKAKARPSRPATRASRCASSPAGSTTSTTTWR